MWKIVLSILLLFPCVAWASDATEALASFTAVDTLLSKSAFLSKTIGLKAVKITVGKEHPQWVHLDFPYSSATGTDKILIEGMINYLVSRGAEPSRPDSLVVGRVFVNRSIAVDFVQKIISGGVAIPLNESVRRDSTAALRWRGILKELYGNRF